MLEEYIYMSENSISKNLCDNIIKYYGNNMNIRYDGLTRAGKDKSVKNTSDLLLVLDAKGYGYDIIETINDVIYTHLKKYVALHPEYNQYHELIMKNGMLIQRYKKKEGKYVYHTDMSYEIDDSILNETSSLSLCNNSLNKLTSMHPVLTRVLTFIIYLNDIDEGGETEFFTDCRVKPKAGTILLFPALWYYNHSGLMPITHDKYILTGWLYTSSK